MRYRKPISKRESQAAMKLYMPLPINPQPERIIEMASSFNKITIVGYLGRDAETSYTPQGTAACKFSVATTEKRKGRDGESQEHTTWFRVTLWGKQAEAIGQYLTKGKLVFVDGRLRIEEYTDKEGSKRTSVEVNANDVQMLGGRGDAAAVGAGGETERIRKDAGLPDADEDIPF